MSTLFTGLKSNRCQIEVNPERGSASVGNSSTRGFRDTTGKKRITRSSSACIQTTKNLCIRQGTLLKSKGEWVSTPANGDECRGQLSFTSSFSLRFPSTKRNDYRTNIRSATKLKNNDLHTESDAGTKVADVQRPEDFLVNALRESTGGATKDEDVSKSKAGVFYSRESLGRHDVSSRRSSDGIQPGLALCDKPEKNCTQGQSASGESVTELRVTEKESLEGQPGVNDHLGKNAEGKLSHSNLIPFTGDTGSKVDSDCQACTCSPINQASLLPSFPDSHCGNNLKSDLISSTAAMFSSTLVSVLAPHWSGRFRRHKRVFSDLGPDIALSQNEQQQRCPLQQLQAQGEPRKDFGNRYRASAPSTKSSVEWQNESFSHLSEPNKQYLKTRSLRMNRHAANQTTEFANPMHASLNSGDLSRSTMSLQLSDYGRTAKSADQGEHFPSSLRSRPTTSTLLLSSRRSCSRNPSSDSFHTEKQSSASVSPLHLPSKSILKTSQPRPNAGSPNDIAKEKLVTKTFLASQDTHKPKPSFPKWGETDSSRDQRYVITGDFDRNPPATNNPTRERLFSNYSTRFNQAETLRSTQDHGAVDWSMYEDKHLQNSNSNIPERSDCFSPKENSRFVFPQISSKLNSDRMLEREIGETSMTSTNLGPSTSGQSNSIKDMINSSSVDKTSTINGTTSPRTTRSIITSPFASLSPVSQAHTDQNNMYNSSISVKPASSPVNSVRTRTFTDSLSLSPRKDSSVEGTSPSRSWSSSPNSKGWLEVSNLSPSSPSEFKLRSICTPSIYRYLRETSPPNNTQASLALSSPTTQTSSLKQKQEEDKNSRKLRFTFDVNSPESRDPVSKPDSSSVVAPQSLPPDTARRSCISKSPYATLISSRAAAVNGLPSPPVMHQHSGAFSHSSSPVDDTSPEVEKRCYTSVHRDRLSQGTSPVRETLGSTDIQLMEKTRSSCQDGIAESSMNAKTPDQTNFSIPDTTHPKLTDSDRWNSRQLSMPLDSSSPVNEVVQKGEVTEISQTSGTFQASQSPKSKRSFFSSRNKKDNVLPSSLSAEKEGLSDKKGETKGLKSNNKVDQVLNRLRITFGGRFSEDSDTTSRRKTKKEESSNVKPYEGIKKEKESDDLTFKTQTKSEELLENKVSERSRKLDRVDDLTVRTPEEVSDSKCPERGQKLVQMNGLTVRRKTKNKTLLDDMPCESKRNVEQTLSESQTLKSPNSPNGQMIKSCNFSGHNFIREKQDDLPNMDEHKSLMEESRSRFLGRPLSPNWPTPENTSWYATLPSGKRSRLGQSRTLSPFEYSLEEQNDNVFFSSVLREERNSTSPGETENVVQPDNVVKTGGQTSTGVAVSSPCADLKYGLQRGRSVSVSSVVSGRPSGPGRISTGSRQGSVSDLSSLDSFVTKSWHSSINSPAGSPENDAIASVGHTSYKGAPGWPPSEGRLRSPDNLEVMSFSWDMETDPTPPHSPPHTRRISSSSSASNKNSPDSLSPRGFLPSRNYKSTLSAFEESDSETTTDDEYYLNSDDDDEQETEV
ncbi:mucin-4 [Tachysurus fulvidraco]|uniref:mucin-4 n=1 Tax=Tachysurus fulvidraco TaxID=1234273 RepID=UPI001FF03EDF|nr:mucin-4 [Tachysurus fulvidraco]